MWPTHHLIHLQLCVQNEFVNNIRVKVTTHFTVFTFLRLCWLTSIELQQHNIKKQNKKQPNRKHGCCSSVSRHRTITPPRPKLKTVRWARLSASNSSSWGERRHQYRNHNTATLVVIQLSSLTAEYTWQIINATNPHHHWQWSVTIEPSWTQTDS